MKMRFSVLKIQEMLKGTIVNEDHAEDTGNAEGTIVSEDREES